MRDHRKLEAFQSADQLVIEIYEATRRLPSKEERGLASQMRRAAVSVAANIAEGCGRATTNELVRFLEIAFGALRELEYFISLMPKLGYWGEDDSKRLLALQGKTARLLCGLIRSVRGK